MPGKKFSLMIVDEDHEVRECLSEIFHNSDYDIRLADSPAAALSALPAGIEAPWPDAIIMGQKSPGAAPDSFLTKLQSQRPAAAEPVSLIVFPSFRVSLPGQHDAAPRQVQACRLSTMSNLMALVRGLAKKRSPAPG